MNREILFRAKSIQTDKWITGYYFEDEDGKSYMGYMGKERYIPDTRDWDTAEYYENNPTYNWVFVKEEVVSETVGQYTSLTDKNDTKIFEGDIVRIGRQFGKYLYGEDNYVCKYDANSASCKFYYIVPKDIADINGYAVIAGGITISEMERGFTIEVIGNIFDNPELLQENG